MLTVVRSEDGQPSTGPSGVVLQSKERMRAAISPGPAKSASPSRMGMRSQFGAHLTIELNIQARTLNYLNIGLLDCFQRRRRADEIAQDQRKRIGAFLAVRRKIMEL